ncbi:MAG: flagellin, partial [Chloroflexi bacterium]|nr:flagellin [Chloroflexota bacterium]
MNDMKGIWQRFSRDEQGITALETAIILIAFVVVASVFAFTILSSGTSSTQQAKEAIAGGLAQVSGALEVRGSVIAVGDIV